MTTRETKVERSSWRIVPWVMVCALSFGGCRDRSTTDDLSHPQESPSAPEPSLCAAIRGNGNLIFAHFGAIARILEDVGEIRGMAGGSSASISAFFYESMLLSPALPRDPSEASNTSSADHADDDPETRREERRDTVALLMKSLLGFAAVVGDSPEGHALQTLTGVGKKVRAQGLLSIVRVNWWDAAQKLHRILSDPEVRELINPAALNMLVNRNPRGMRDYRFKVAELVRAAAVVDGFEPNDPSMFFREPIMSYDGFTKVLGRIANFYAGVDPLSNAYLQDFIDACLPVSRGHTWDEIAASPVAQGTCGSLFAQAVTTYRTRVRTHAWTPPVGQDRLQHTLGQYLPIYVPAAILDGPAAVTTFTQSLEAYRRQKKPSLPVDFDDVRFGFFTPFPQGLEAVRTMKDRFPTNAKVDKAIQLNTHAPTLWQEALRYSTLEPGLSRIIQVDDERAYIGGWGDLHPTQILRAAGCDKIIYLNRIGPETAFVAKQHDYDHLPPGERHGVAEWLNMTSEQYWRLYDMKNTDNAYNQSVKEADAIWCTDWDSALPSETSYMFDHSYGSLPSSRGPNAGHQSGMAVRSAADRELFLRHGIPQIRAPLWGCVAP